MSHFVGNECTFITGNAEYIMAQLTDDLRIYDVKSNIDLAVQPNTPDHCVRKARAAARRVGFKAAGIKSYNSVPASCLPMQGGPAPANRLGKEELKPPRQ